MHTVVRASVQGIVLCRAVQPALCPPLSTYRVLLCSHIPCVNWTMCQAVLFFTAARGPPEPA